MVSTQVTIVNKLGMHARAAATFVKESTRFECEIWIEKGKNRVNGKSIMGILTLAAAKGETLTIEAEGPDEAYAIEVLVRIVSRGFDENELRACD